MKMFDIPPRRGIYNGTMTIQSLPKRFIDATRDYDPDLERKENETKKS